MAPPFLDTNILVYAFSEDPRSEIADRLLSANFVIGVQTLNEFANAASRKLAMDWPTVARAISRVTAMAERIVSTEADDLHLALTLAGRHRLSIFDALMISIALRAECTTFHSEDLHHGLLIEDTLRIQNPFL